MSAPQDPVQRVAGRSPSATHTPETPGRRLDEMLDVGLDVVRRGLDSVGPESDFEAIQRVFQHAQEAIHTAGSVYKSSDEGGDERETDLVRFDEVPGLTDAQFLAVLEDLEAQRSGPFAPELDVVEALAVLLAIFLEGGPDRETHRARLEPFLQSVSHDRDREIWFGAAAEIADAELRPFVDRALTRCSLAMRYANPNFAQRLGRALRRATSADHYENLWPWAANEFLLIDRERGQEVPPELVRVVSALPPHRMSSAFPRLLQLDAVAKGKLTGDAFRVRRMELFRFWAELLAHTQSAPIATATVLRGLRMEPPGWDGSFVLDGLWEDHPWAASVLRQFLFDWPVDYPSPTLVELTARATAHTLEVMDPHTRQEPWTLAAIAWLGTSRFAAARKTLEDILAERRGLLMLSWPRAARRAARQALAQLEKDS